MRSLFNNRRSAMAAGKDRRIERTQQLLRGALFSLIEEKGFEALSVQQIIDRANVGRATFYAHFDNKDALLLSGFDDLLELLRKRQRQALASSRRQDENLLAFSHDVFAHAEAHRAFFRVMAGKRSGAAVKQQLHHVLVMVIREELKTSVAVTRSAASDALVQFLAGALFGVLTWWLEARSRMSVEEIDGLFRQLAIPALKAARG
jgi:AcrR family transcriptional regulator